jgi:excisionase family DNA binding protein
MRHGSNAARWQDLADALGLGEDAVKAAILSGELPGYKIGKRYVVPREAYEAVCNGTWVAHPRPILAGELRLVHRKAS